MNKKILALILVMAMALSMVLAGCGAKEEAEPTYIGIADDPFGELPTAQVIEPDATEATQPQPTETPTEATTPGETTPVVTTPATTVPTQTETTAPTEPEDPGKGVTYQQYTAMTADQQREFAKKFSSRDAFLLWYDAAMEEAKQNDVIEVTGPVDLDQYN